MNRVRLLLSIALVAATGCGSGSTDPQTGKVTGKVMLDGKPGAGLQVTFQPIDGGRSSMGIADGEGVYTLIYSPETLGARIGKHRVFIAAGEPPVDAPTDRKPLTSTVVPKKYSENPKQVEVVAGNNTIDLTYP